MEFTSGTFLTRLLWVLTVAHIVANASLETMDEEVNTNPVQEALDNGLSDLIKSISSIQDHLRNIKMPTTSNISSLVESEMKRELNVITKDVSYDNLVEKIQLAKNKIKEIQRKVGSTVEDLEKNWPQVNITRHHP